MEFIATLLVLFIAFFIGDQLSDYCSDELATGYPAKQLINDSVSSVMMVDRESRESAWKDFMGTYPV